MFSFLFIALQLLTKILFHDRKISPICAILEGRPKKLVVYKTVLAQLAIVCSVVILARRTMENIQFHHFFATVNTVSKRCIFQAFWRSIVLEAMQSVVAIPATYLFAQMAIQMALNAEISQTSITFEGSAEITPKFFIHDRFLLTLVLVTATITHWRSTALALLQNTFDATCITAELAVQKDFFWNSLIRINHQFTGLDRHTRNFCGMLVRL